MSNNFKTYSLTIKGIVQGVGFRPFIWLLFNNMNISGMVTNTTEGVYIEANFKSEKELLDLVGIIKQKKPGPSLIESIEYQKIPDKVFNDFVITKSVKKEEKFQLISPDLATCISCMADINNPEDQRRYRYAFTNCTNCGPRFTIIDKMPYDRHNTTMKDFIMCPECLAEYNDPADRRFHAQPNACKKCGPHLVLTDNKGAAIKTEDTIASACSLLKKGRIIGLKSLGGFQIACDATSDKTVAKLRKRKNRPAKPFAVMFKDIEMLKKYLEVNPAEKASLISAYAPIVLLKKKDNNEGQKSAELKSGVQKSVGQKSVEQSIDFLPLSTHVSHYNNYEGALLPYTPMHHLLFKNISIPLVMTSGNISEEPIASRNVEAADKLQNICDFFLMHDRDIYSKYDDSVLKIINGCEMTIRRARGMAPYPLKLDIDIGNRAVLATGAQEKNTFCLLTKNYAILSQHIGDLDSMESYRFFQDTLDGYMQLFAIDKIDIVAYDKHPDYMSSKFAAQEFKRSDKVAIQHHQAHIAGVIAENRLSEKKVKNILGFAWDGTGFGDDSKVWGSEIFLVNPDLDFKHIGHLKEKLLPGGDASIKRPYRMAATYLYNYWQQKHYDSFKNFEDFIYGYFPFYKKIITASEMEILTAQIKTGYNSPVTTSMGRFFDAVSSILDLTHIATYEGEAAIRLEMTADSRIKDFYDIKNNKIDFIIDDNHIFSQIVEDVKSGIPAEQISAKFHNTMVKIIINISLKIKKELNINTVALSGGVFQNNIMIKKSFELLKKEGFDVYSAFKTPVNDGGISLGQAYIAAKMLKNKSLD